MCQVWHRHIWQGRKPGQIEDLSFHVLTIASPDLSQVAADLAGLFAELDDIAARRLRGDRHLGYSLFPITEVHSQDHLKVGKKML